MFLQTLLLLATLGADPLSAGDTTRTLQVDGRQRSYLVHIPANLDLKQPAPVVLVFHGAGANDVITVLFTGMSKKADSAGFIAVYPNGLGIGMFQVFNAGGLGRLGDRGVDDVKYVGKLLDDLEGVVNVDKQRVFATGMSNGGMMCYRLAAEMSDRIAAIAPVAGTMAIDKAAPKRPVPVLHFHGLDDTIVPVGGPNADARRFVSYQSVDDTIKAWCQIDGCDEKPEIAELPSKVSDGTSVKRKRYGSGKDGVEVVLYEISGAGHTWPGQNPGVKFLGKSTMNINANDLIWEFFQKHPRP